MDYAKELNVALEAAAKASDYLRGAYAAFTPIPDAPASISTEADRTSQDLILAHLLAAFPDDALCAEEGTAALREAKRQGPRLWVVDPIDGTRGFAMKNGEFSVMIGLPNRLSVGSPTPGSGKAAGSAPTRGWPSSVPSPRPPSCRTRCSSRATRSAARRCGRSRP